MIEGMYIGSGDVYALLSGRATDTHLNLLRRFVSGEKPYYNAKNSPIDALRTGAILEDRYLLTLPDNYFAQHVVISPDMDVFKCSLDFAKIEGGEVIDFDELKTMNLLEFITLEPLRNYSAEEANEYVFKHFSRYYNQMQEQLYCTELDEANMVFLAVTSYDDEENRNRIIEPEDTIKVRICRNEEVIDQIKKRAAPFQMLKDFYIKNQSYVYHKQTKSQ